MPLIDDHTLYCFEDEADASLYAGWYPDKASQIFSATKLAGALSETVPLSVSERRLLADDLFPDESPEYQIQLLSTIEFLRTAWLMTAEDLDYAFEQLPSIPKNEKLHSQAKRYLESDLKNDFVQQLWETREKLRSPLGSNWDRQVRFFSSDTKSPLFEEIAKSFPGAPKPEELFAWNEDSPLAAKGAVLWGSSADSLRSLVETLSRRRSHKDGESTVIAFGGSPAELVYLKTLLCAQQMVFTDFTSLSPSRSETEVTDPLALLRLSRLSEATKLRLGKVFFQNRARQRAQRLSPSEWWSILEQSGQLTPEERTSLMAAAPLSPLTSPQDPSPEVSLVPFRPYVLSQDTTLYAFAGASALAVTAPHLLLTVDEIESLRIKGLPLASPYEMVSRRESFFNYFAKARTRETFLFSSIPRDRFPEARYFKVSRVRRNPAVAISPQEPNLSFAGGSFSATGLENFAQCPAKFLFVQRLRLRTAASDSTDSFPLYYGQLVHKSLELALQEPEPKLFDPQWLMGYLQRSIELLFPTLPLQTALHTLIRDQFKKTARHIGRMEETLRELRGPGKTIAFEQEFTFEWKGHPVRGFIDRIDQNANGDLLVIDYKTGNVDFSPSHIQDGHHFQALVYLIAVEKLFGKPAAGVLFYDLKKFEIRRGLLRAEAFSAEAKKAITRGHVLEPEKFELITRAGTEAMDRLMGMSDRGHFPATPNAAACGLCDYAILCRRAHGYR